MEEVSRRTFLIRSAALVMGAVGYKLADTSKPQEAAGTSGESSYGGAS